MAGNKLRYTDYRSFLAFLCTFSLFVSHNLGQVGTHETVLLERSNR